MARAQWVGLLGAGIVLNLLLLSLRVAFGINFLEAVLLALLLLSAGASLLWWRWKPA